MYSYDKTSVIGLFELICCITFDNYYSIVVLIDIAIT